jgi:hypothetical protein
MGCAVSYAPIIAALCRQSGLPQPEPEFRFAPPRKWRFDFCWREQGVALEVQGGIWTRGRHTRGAALLAEQEKLNAAAAQGFRVLFCTPKTIGDAWPAVVTAITRR